MNRRDFIKIGASATALLMHTPAWAAQPGNPLPSDAEILRQAAASIEQHRKGDGVISVRNAKDEAIPGALVRVEQLSHEFPFGSDLFTFDRCGKAGLAEPHRQSFQALLNDSTVSFGWAWPLHKVWNTCDGCIKLGGLPLHCTEPGILGRARQGPAENRAATDAERETRQAELAAKFCTTLFGHPAVQAITWSDPSEPETWQGAVAGRRHQDMYPKPVYDRVVGLIKGAWWTSTELPSNTQGELHLRAYYGIHRITVRLPNGQSATQEVSWTRGSKNQFLVIV